MPDEECTIETSTVEKYAPIVLFVYSRLAHTKKVVNALLNNPEASQSCLYIFSDGPKVNATEETRKEVAAVKEYIATIKGFKNIEIESFERNQGLAQITIYGMSKIFNSYDRAIMLEDDDVPSPYFLSYENRCLEKYAKDERIWCVSGYIDNGYVPAREGDDLFLVNRSSSWGFGTWKRCWEKVIWDINTLRGIFRHKDVVVGFNRWAGTDVARIMFETFPNISNSWSVRYSFAGYLNMSYTILPNKSLISSIGMDGTGTHGDNSGRVVTMMERDVIIPKEIKFDPIRNEQVCKSVRGRGLRSRVVSYAELHPVFHKIIYSLTGKKDSWKVKE
mgnify:CR=1 FL=1